MIDKLSIITAGIIAAACCGKPSSIPIPPPPPPSGGAAISMNASAWAFQHSPGMPLSPGQVNSSTWAFAFPFQNGVHYLTYAMSGALSARAISVWVQIDRVGQLMEVDPCGPNNALMRLFFQRRGDDLSAAKEFYRWWSTETLPLNDTSYVQFKQFQAPLEPSHWSQVFGKNGAGYPGEWAAAANDVQAVGMTFGGCFGGHGVYTSGGNAYFLASNYALL